MLGSMATVPSLLSLCVDAAKDHIFNGHDDYILRGVYLLPTELFDCLLKRLPALALHNLQFLQQTEQLPDDEFYFDSPENAGKRVRCSKFSMAWMTLFRSRWPEICGQAEHENASMKQDLGFTSDWQQKYWEMHMQNCFDAAAEKAMLPSFDGCIGEIGIPDALKSAIGFEGTKNSSIYSKFCDHCEQFGCYLRSLRLQSVLCVAETCKLLSKSKLQSLGLRRISSEVQVNALCKILNQNGETIASVEFINCKLSSAFIDAICDSLCMRGLQINRVQHFAVRRSKLSVTDPAALPAKLASFLSSGRSLCSLSFPDVHIGRGFARLILKTLMDAYSGLSALDLSENNISGWLTDFFRKTSKQTTVCLETDKCLQSLVVLNLRGCNLHKNDAENLISVLVHMPKLETLDMSDNPIEDEGMVSLIPYLLKTAEHFPLANLSLKNCELSCIGVAEFLEVLSDSKYLLTSLSLAGNDLGCKVAAPLGKFLRTSIRFLDIRDIGLGPSGFLELERSIVEVVNLFSINISENRGGIHTAKFLATLISMAPELLSVDTGYNLMPLESLTIICSALKVANGKLQHLDLMGNPKLCQFRKASSLSEFQYNGQPIVKIPTSAASDALYDDDP